MRTSVETNEIFSALAKAQKVFKNPEKNKTAVIPKKAGGSYTFNYADLPGCFDTVRHELADNGLSHSFGTTVEAACTVCSARLSHSSGQWIESEMVLPPSEDIKGIAANITYLRRYLFCGLVGIAGDEDLDGEPDAGAKITDKKSNQQKRAPVAPKEKMTQMPPGTDRDALLLKVKDAYMAIVKALPHADPAVVMMDRYKAAKITDLKTEDAWEFLMLIEAELKKGAAV